jgi:hypothetical protein
LGLMVNNDDTLFDLPSGKEITNNLEAPFAVIREKDGKYIAYDQLDLIQLQSFDLKSYYMHHYQRNMF